MPYRPKGAQGLMQPIPATARRFGVVDAFDPKENIEGGVKYLEYLQTLFPNDLNLTIAAYNAGEGAVSRYTAFRLYPERWLMWTAFISTIRMPNLPRRRRTWSLRRSQSRNQRVTSSRFSMRRGDCIWLLAERRMRCLPRRISVLAVFTAALSPSLTPYQAQFSGPRIEAIRFWSFGDVTRIAIETHGDYKLSSERLDNPPRLFFDLTGVLPPVSRQKGVQALSVGDHLVRQIRVAETEPGITRIVFDLEVPADFSCSQLVNPERLMIELRPRAGLAKPSNHTPRSCGE